MKHLNLHEITLWKAHIEEEFDNLVEIVSEKKSDTATLDEATTNQSIASGTIIDEDTKSIVSTFNPILRNKGTGMDNTIKGYIRRGGKWIQKTHGRYTVAAITDEHMTSQLCVYCFTPIVHPHNNDGSINFGTSRCTNHKCAAFCHGRATNNRDRMSAAAIGLTGMTKLLINKNLSPFTESYFKTHLYLPLAT